MRDLSCLTKEEQKAVAGWLDRGACGCPFAFYADSTCYNTCGKVFPECVGKTSFGVDYISCPCNRLTCDYVISELGDLPHE